MNYAENRYKAEVVRWVDGDTVDMLVDLGQGVCIKGRYRLARIDAPEIRKRAGVTDAEKSAGLSLLASLKSEFPKGTLFAISTSKQGKFGRYLVEMYPIGSDESLNDRLLREGLAKPYQ